jgi:hypothetical protein
VSTESAKKGRGGGGEYPHLTEHTLHNITTRSQSGGGGGGREPGKMERGKGGEAGEHSEQDPPKKQFHSTLNTQVAKHSLFLFHTQHQSGIVEPHLNQTVLVP